MSEPGRDPKRAATDQPLHDVLAARWSPVGFDPERAVAKADLAALFEAARWAASSYNEQPWRYLVATRDDAEGFQRLLSCLVPGNQNWAQDAPVLALGLFKRALERSGKPNRAAAHDLGAASASLTFEATARGLYVHQMIGIDPDTARSAYAIPESFEALTALAIGRLRDPAALDPALAERDAKPRQREPLSELLFAGRFGAPYGV